MARRPFESVGDFVRRGLAYAHKRYIRRFMPRTAPVLYAGYASTLDWRLFDRSLPSTFRPPEIEDVPDYEEKLVAALKQTVKAGHRVVVVGGGIGATAVVAAKLAGPAGAVVCYEASAEQLPIIKETFRRNKVDIDLRYAAVGEAIGVYGENADAAPLIAPEELPECDVLEMDCEGAERLILDRMTIRPHAIAVETHGFYKAPTPEVHRALEGLGYRVTDLGYAEPRLADICREWDVNVLLGVRAD